MAGPIILSWVSLLQASGQRACCLRRPPLVHPAIYCLWIQKRSQKPRQEAPALIDVQACAAPIGRNYGCLKGCASNGTAQPRERVDLLHLHRSPLPTANAHRLFAHVLRLLSERMVLPPTPQSHPLSYSEPHSVYLPNMSGRGEGCSAQCYDQHTAGYVPSSES